MSSNNDDEGHNIEVTVINGDPEYDGKTSIEAILPDGTSKFLALGDSVEDAIGDLVDSVINMVTMAAYQTVQEKDPGLFNNEEELNKLGIVVD